MNTILSLEICLSHCKDNTRPIAKASGLKNYFVTVSEDMRDIGTYRLIRVANPDSGEIAKLHIPNKFEAEKDVFLEFWTSDDASKESNIIPIGALAVHKKNGEFLFKVSHPNEYLGLCFAQNMHRFMLKESPIPYNICLNTVII